MHSPLIVGNWKMFGNIQKARDLAADLTERVQTTPLKAQMVVCPPYIHLPAVRHRLVASSIALGAQNCHYSKQGPFTGDISPDMLVDIGCQYVILGHSERRLHHNESNAIILKKAEAAHKCGLTVILCIGETLKEREEKNVEEILEQQWRASLPSTVQPANIVIAYEPVWAIGSGLTPQFEDLVPVYKKLRALADEYFTDGSVRLLYGGSVNSQNIEDFKKVEEINGVLVGGASLNAEEFFHIALSYN